jgi:hypothetical protein
LKKVLIISPYFPPVNAADMQRVRMSLPYFTDLGWDATVVAVDEIYTDLPQDPLLLQTLPTGTKIHKVKAFKKQWTSKLGLGSIALRSLWFYKQKVNQLLADQAYDLIYFSTTQFPVCILGAYWKKKFGIPYVIDMQDPWHSDYYRDKARAQRPPKYWFSYRLNKYLEPIALQHADGLISVSPDYICALKKRYPAIRHQPSAVITFGSFETDMHIARKNADHFMPLLDPQYTNIVYIGRGGTDMYPAISPLFQMLQQHLPRIAQKSKPLKLFFIGTSYAANGLGKPTILPLAKQYGLGHMVVEITDRISYYHTLQTLLQADALFIPGSDDPQYTASKIFPYLLTQKPILAIFNAASSAISILKEYGVTHTYAYEHITDKELLTFFSLLNEPFPPPSHYAPEAIKRYSAAQMARSQCSLFDAVIYSKK